MLASGFEHRLLECIAVPFGTTGGWQAGAMKRIKYRPQVEGTPSTFPPSDFKIEQVPVFYAVDFASPIGEGRWRTAYLGQLRVHEKLLNPMVAKHFHCTGALKNCMLDLQIHFICARLLAQFQAAIKALPCAFQDWPNIVSMVAEMRVSIACSGHT